MRLRAVPLYALAVFILYGNVATMLRPPARALGLPPPPLPAEVVDLFHLFGVFHSYERINREVFIEAQGADGAWVRLRDADHAPFPRGERHTRLWAARSFGHLGRPIAAARLAMLDKIRQREARLHPERPPPRRLRIVEESWPRSPAGYLAGRRPEAVRTQVWFAEPGP